VSLDSVDIGLHRVGVTFNLEFVDKTFRGGKICPDGRLDAAEGFGSLPNRGSITDENPFTRRQIDGRAHSRDGVGLDRHFGDGVNRSVVTLQSDTSGALQGPSGKNTVRSRRDDRDFRFRDAGKVYVSFRGAGRECSATLQFRKGVSLGYGRLDEIDMVDISPVVRDGFVVDQEVRAGVDMVRSMQRNVPYFLIGVDVEGRHSL
jgi:hypothetical protein